MTGLPANPTGPVIRQLDRYGPEHCDAMTPEQARAYVRAMTLGHNENFTVLSRLVPRRLRDDFAAVYAFCRWADDLGDETGDRARSLELLGWWRRELADCYADRPRHPVFLALRETIGRHDIPSQPFEDLIDAFEQDQRIDRYETWAQVLDYCRRSANPVGRVVLYLCGYRDDDRQRLSDATCTALQLANFWQDVRRDILERDRIYMPLDALAVEGLSHDDLAAHVRNTWPLTDEQMAGYQRVMGRLVERTWELFARGRGLWPLVDRAVRVPVQLFSLGGQKVLKKIERMDYRTLESRPVLSRLDKGRLMLGALAGRWLGVGMSSRIDFE